MATQNVAKRLYAPLDKNKKEIRLLRVKPYAKDDDVLSICECTMFTACLADEPTPKYNAFSYEWNYSGDLSEDYSAKDAIIVNQQRVPATKNLVALLTRFRNVSQTMPDYQPFQLPLWIDALCINQSDVDERNSQVAMMGAIYTKAQATLAWLGESEDDSDYAMQVISEFGSKLLKDVGKNDDQLSWIDPHSQPELWQRSGSLNRFWDSAGALMRRSYWKRAWIIQEVLLQPNVVIFCGRNIGHYLQIEAIFHWLKRIQHQPCPAGVDEELWNLLSTKAGWYQMGWGNMQRRIRVIPSTDSNFGNDVETSRHLDWKMWIMNTMNKLASDPRDKLYSVLGLVGIDDLKPDYSCSAERVYYDFTADDIRLCKSLDVLSYAGYFESEVKSPATNLFVPSWVPNWDQISKVYNFTWTHRKGEVADKGWESVISVAEGEVPWSIGDHILTAQGVLFDAIVETRACNLHDGSWVAFCHEYVQSQAGELYPSGIPPLQALALLVLRGWGYDSHPLGPDPRINDLVYRALPGFLLTLWSGSSTTQADDMKREQTRLGLGTPRGVLSNFIGEALVHRQELSKSAEDGDGGDQWKDLAPNTMNFRHEASRGMDDHLLFRTMKGYLGWARRGAKEGDLVCVLPRCSQPVVLRDVETHHILMGSCHVTGLMRGEAIVAARDGTAQVKTFDIA